MLVIWNFGQLDNTFRFLHLNSAGYEFFNEATKIRSKQYFGYSDGNGVLYNPNLHCTLITLFSYQKSTPPCGHSAFGAEGAKALMFLDSSGVK